MLSSLILCLRHFGEDMLSRVDERRRPGPLLPILHSHPSSHAHSPSLICPAPSSHSVLRGSWRVVLTVGEVCAPEEVESAVSRCDANNPPHYFHPKKPILGKGERDSKARPGIREVKQRRAPEFHQELHQHPRWGGRQNPPTGSHPSYSSGWCLSSPP